MFNNFPASIPGPGFKQGQTFLALDPNCFADGFEERLQQFMDETREMDPVSKTTQYNYTALTFRIRLNSASQSDPSLPVLVAGDPERSSMKRVKENGGIFYHQSLITAMVGVCACGLNTALVGVCACALFVNIALVGVCACFLNTASVGVCACAATKYSLGRCLCICVKYSHGGCIAMVGVCSCTTKYSLGGCLCTC